MYITRGVSHYGGAIYMKFRQNFDIYIKKKNTDENTVMHHPRNDPKKFLKKKKKKEKEISVSILKVQKWHDQSTSLFKFLNK